MPLDLFDDSVVIPAIRRQIIPAGETIPSKTYFDAPDIDLSLYDRYVLCLSGGKDSIAAALRLKEIGVDMRLVEFWHHDIDGREGSELMDWHFMASYNRALASAFGVPLYFSWLEGGFEGEMLKENGYSRPHKFETPTGLITLERDLSRMRPGTRRRFPQQSKDLNTRWCSSALKIDVGRRALNNQARFEGARTLFITGERRKKALTEQNTTNWSLMPAIGGQARRRDTLTRGGQSCTGVKKRCGTSCGATLFWPPCPTG